MLEINQYKPKQQQTNAYITQDKLNSGKYLQICNHFWHRRDSNPGPLGPKSNTLPPCHTLLQIGEDILLGVQTIAAQTRALLSDKGKNRIFDSR